MILLLFNDTLTVTSIEPLLEGVHFALSDVRHFDMLGNELCNSIETLPLDDPTVQVQVVESLDLGLRIPIREAQARAWRCYRCGGGHATCTCVFEIVDGEEGA